MIALGGATALLDSSFWSIYRGPVGDFGWRHVLKGRNERWVDPGHRRPVPSTRLAGWMTVQAPLTSPSCSLTFCNALAQRMTIGETHR